MRIGIDIVKISRFNKSIKNEKFLNKTFLQSEIEYAKNKGEKNVSQTLAGIFATKEAFFKAVGAGIINTASLTEIEVSHLKSGAPIVKIADNIINKYDITNKIHVSISHDAGLAISVVVIE